ncbi:MAG: hypothetical protein EOO09_15370 [Chitinophagaceae bacterium]|nr:MAG: hypothetical protein EOO09_15370 [Chitinophagaceae bacterium]
MKPKSIKIGRAVSVFAIIASTVILLSWQKQTEETAPPGHSRPSTLNLKHFMAGFACDTTPNKYKQPKDIDEAIEQLEKLDIEKEMKQAMESVKIAMDQLDDKKIKLEIEKAMKSVDMDKVKKDVELSLDEADMAGLKDLVKESLAKVDWDQIQRNLNKINWKEMQDGMRTAQLELKKQGPVIKLEMEKAKIEIEKATKELKEYKVFIDDLDKDGLINKEKGYTLELKDGELKIDGKKASDATHKKYRSFLEEHKQFHIESRDGKFNMNDNNWNDEDQDNDNENDSEDVVS